MRRTIAAACGAALPFVVAAQTLAGETRRAVVVVVPEIGEPFRSVFAKIAGGIEARIPGRVTVLAVGGHDVDVAGELRRRDAGVVVALGRQGLKAVASLDDSFSIIAGCVVSLPEDDERRYPVYTLAPDPLLLFAQLRRLAPAVRRISVVYDPRQTGWLIRRAREAAQSMGWELSAYEARELPAALRQYQQQLSAADATRDAIWLPQDASTVDDATVLPLVLKEAWSRSLVAFSSNVAHVKRGALFALYPDNEQLGHTLGDAASRLLAGVKGGEGSVLPLREVRSAINTRTAAHLGLVLKSPVADYDLVFPEP